MESERRIIGKWLLDVAKYVTTAILLTKILSNNIWSWYNYLIAIAIIASTFIGGFYLVRERKKRKE